MTSTDRFIVVAGIDFSEQADQALDWALAMASQRGSAEVHVVHVESDRGFGAAASGHERGADGTVELVQRRAASRMAHLGAAIDRTRILRVVAHYRHGSPAEGIAQLAADLHADTIIVGSRGAGGARPYRGSVAEQLSRLAQCTVIIVPDSGRHVGGVLPPIERARHAVGVERRTYASNGIYGAEGIVHESPRPSERKVG